VPLASKRDLLARVAAEHGLVPLMMVGRGLSRLPTDPALEALVRASGPHDLLARWQRLERFLHSRHRLVAEESSERHYLIRHVGPETEPPSPGEDALILGVLAELCQHIGTLGFYVTMVGPNGVAHPVLAEGCFAEPPLGLGATGLWRFAWAAVERWPRKDAECPRSLLSDAWPEPRAVAERVSATVAGDLGRAWSLADLAHHFAMSERTLQRRLSEAGATLADLIRAARVEAAGRLLIDTPQSLGKVGFACGFSDQAHFTKLFKRQTAMTPAAYRRAFTSLEGVR
jgi:AraC-like DNA-binding protein